MNRNAILYFFSFLAIGSIIFVLIMELALKKWKCTDQKNCVRILGGNYDSEGKCHDSCASLEKISNVPTSDTYDCVNNTCRKAEGDQGLYNSSSECEDNCGSQTVVSVNQPYGYPYYGYPYYTYRYPYYWRHRRIHHPRSSRRRRPSSRLRRSRSRSPRFGNLRSVVRSVSPRGSGAGAGRGRR